jgi:hypothetical protein
VIRVAPKLLIPFGTIVLSIIAMLTVPSLVRGGVSPGTAGIVAGVLGTLAVVGIIGGIFGARRSEERRRAKEHIWLKH